MNELGNTPADKDYKPSGISRAESKALERFPEQMTPLVYQDVIDAFGGKTEVDFNLLPRSYFQLGYEQAEKETVERVIDWLEEHFMDSSHHSGRGDYGRIDTFDFDSMEDMFNNLKKAMEEK